MPAARPNHAFFRPPAGRISRRDTAVLRLALAWRDLTGGRARGQDRCRRTILACSGGGDSVGLTVGLAAAVSDPRGIFVIAHIVHDLRPRDQALADRDAVRSVAQGLGLPFVEREIAVRAAATGGGNAEAAARRLRYQALAALAAEHGCHFVATAHHAQDQFESLLMALLRGSGTRGLRGIAPSRKLPPPAEAPHKSIRLIRPALETDTSDLRRLCTEAGIRWVDDATNADTSRLRAALRHQIVPMLEVLRPGAARRAARTAHLIGAADALIASQTRELLEIGREPARFSWPREMLRHRPPIVLGALLRAAAASLSAGLGRDRLGSRTVMPAIRALRDRTNDPRTFALSHCTLTIDAHRASMSASTEH